MKVIVTALAVIASTTVADAAPVFPECVPDQMASVHLADGMLVGCWGMSCMDLKTRKAVPPPATRLPPVVREATKVSFCSGGTCNPAGPALSVAISSWMDAKTKRDTSGIEERYMGSSFWVKVTLDHRFVLIANPGGDLHSAPDPNGTHHLWSTERDARIDVVRPAGTESQNTRMEVVGSHVVAMGTICTKTPPCRGTTWIVDATGNPVGDFLDGDYAPLGPDRIAVSAPWVHKFAIVDATKGQVIATTRLPTALETAVAITAITDDRLALIAEIKGGFRWGVVRVTGKKVAQVGSAQTIKICPKPKLLRRDSSSSARP